MKRLQVAAMVALLALGFWLAIGPSLMGRSGRTQSISLVCGGRKISAERIEGGAAGDRYRFLTHAADLPQGELGADEFWGAVRKAEATAAQGAWTERILAAFNTSSTWQLWWVVLGFGGQMAFFGRMLVQWIASEREGRSVVPPAFWWLSLAGGAALFAYFVWRRDVVGVMGQSAGVVIYARNLALIRGERRSGNGGEERLEAAALREDAPNPQAV